MTSTQFNKALIKLDLSQARFARIIDASPRNVNRWATGKWPVPVTVGLLLNLMLDHDAGEADLRR